MRKLGMKMKRLMKTSLVVFLLLVGIQTQAQYCQAYSSWPIATGVNQNTGAAATCWTIVADNGVNQVTPRPARVVTATGPGWIPNSVVTNWISNSTFSSPANAPASSVVTYRYYFNITHNSHQMNQLQLNIYADGDFRVALNGGAFSTEYTKVTSGTRQTVTFTSGFVNGSNYVDIKVYNDDATGNSHTGINVTGTILASNNILQGCDNRSISGKVYLDLDGSGAKNVGVAGVFVELLDVNNAVHFPQTTDGSGNYTFCLSGRTGPFKVRIQLPTNGYEYLIVAPDNGTTNANRHYHENLNPSNGTSLSNIDFRLSGYFYEANIVKVNSNTAGTGCADYRTEILLKRMGSGGGTLVADLAQNPNHPLFAGLNVNVLYSVGSNPFQVNYPGVGFTVTPGNIQGLQYTYDLVPLSKAFQRVKLVSGNSKVYGFMKLENNQTTRVLKEIGRLRYGTVMFENQIDVYDCCPTPTVATEQCWVNNSTKNRMLFGILGQVNCFGTAAGGNCDLADADVTWTIANNPIGMPNTGTTTINEVDPEHQFPMEGIYPCTLEVRYPNCPIYTQMFDFYLYDKAATLQWPSNACKSQSLQFGITPNSALSNISYLWDFGDGTTSTQQNPQHTYAEGGTYQVNLTLSLGTVCKEWFYQTIHVAGASIQAPDDICLGTAIDFPDFRPYATVTAGPQPNSYSWNFGDGNTANSFDPSHTYLSAGTYTVSLTSSYFGGSCTNTEVHTVQVYDPNPTLTVPTVSCFGSPTNYSVSFNPANPTAPSGYTWNWGDGSAPLVNQSSASNSYPEGTYTLSLATTFSPNCSSTVNRSLIVDKPFVGISGPRQLCSGQRIDFLPIYSSATENVPSIRNWNFGDGNTSNQLNASHTYTLPNGTPTQQYTVNLTTTTGHGCTASASLPITVEAELERNINIRAFTNVCLGSAVQFFLDGDTEDALSYDWDFGNNTDASIANPKVIYDQSGTYTVSVSANYAQNCISNNPEDEVTVKVDKFDFCSTCSECIGSFAPQAGGKYVLSAWVKESDFLTKATYNASAIAFYYEGVNEQSRRFKAKGPIIEGWQLIEEEFIIPEGTSAIQVELLNLSDKDVFFDDIRIYPFDANLKSFVYDPITMRLTAELDEKNYATFYEYDEDGNLIRVKKETERGIKTIQETIKRVKQE